MKLHLSTTSIPIKGIYDREKLTSDLLSEQGVKKVEIDREMVYVTYKPAEVPLMLVYQVVQRNCRFVSGG
jgi:hypothetical protein